MKKRKRKRGRKRVYKAAPPSFPVAINIYKKWIDKEENAPVDFGRVMCACTLELVDGSGTFPFTLNVPDDENRTVYLRVTGVERLDKFQMVQVVDSDSEEGQEMAKVAEVFKDISLGSGRYSESEVDDAIAAVVMADDKVRVPLIDCGAGEDTIRRMVPPQQVDSDNWNDLPLLPITTLQQVFEDFLEYLLSDAVIDGTSDADISFAGDRRWLVQGGELDTFMQRWEASRVVTV